MTFIIFVTFIAFVTYFFAAFIATMRDRLMSRFTPIAPIQVEPATELAPIAPTPFQMIRPALAVQSSRLYRHLGIRPLRVEIKRLELAAKCQELHGKSWSRCSKDQLIATLDCC